MPQSYLRFIFLSTLAISLTASVNASSGHPGISEIQSKIQSWKKQTQHPIATIPNPTHNNSKTSSDDKQRRPFVTLSYAQTMDGMIALNSKSSNLIISSKESLFLTHGLRSIHDAILVGGGTMLVDNPRLNVRYWEGKEKLNSSEPHPRPVVLDADLKCVRKLKNQIRARNLIVCCNEEAADRWKKDLDAEVENDDSPDDLESCISILPCRVVVTADGVKRLDLSHVLQRLKDVYGIQSVMVEGGASVLSSFLESRLVNCMCVTIAPSILGGVVGLPAFGSFVGGSDGTGMLRLDEVGFWTLGGDCILVGCLKDSLL